VHVRRDMREKYEEGGTHTHTHSLTQASGEASREGVDATW
jgi:hypothetical protein